ncbi:GDP-fucose protein O-fucosyltransferase 2-like isoform X2 [Schistocerca piceifrons]|uniref:GDP-fucose protein O-fucosyltransferase 2-like isoform X2 n=1 Tax=Schistocerca piceifrons TaxID=274613 RepID=UPI001F5EDDA4|nr:GDP-fucose protein O-fucosyltransferase 2-like isoform X2 [Schistocerca piceifrons]
MEVSIRGRVLLTIYFEVLIVTTSFSVLSETPQFCVSEEDGSNSCHPRNVWNTDRYILYDVNPPEGFNLRRDVYMRMAVLMKTLQSHGNWKLVLPPWPKLYHWQSTDVGRQDMLPWSLFFDIESLKKFTPVVEMTDFFSEVNTTIIDHVFYLQHPKDLWKDENFEERYSIDECPQSIPYRKVTKDGIWRGKFWGYSNLTATDLKCISFHGHVSLLVDILKNIHKRAVMIDHAEIALHDAFGDKVYWEVRRSMRFALPLVEIATEFRKDFLDSDDDTDGTVRPRDWQMEKGFSEAHGGPYLCVHLRRKDFVWARAKDVPSIKGAAQQISELLKNLELDTVFIATDAPKEGISVQIVEYLILQCSTFNSSMSVTSGYEDILVSEFKELKSFLRGYNVLRYKAPAKVKEKYKDGGVAIIEQIICSHARYFIGSYESTFSFRIQEEREIMGFPTEATYNRLCGDGVRNCSKPAQWRVVF